MSDDDGVWLARGFDFGILGICADVKDSSVVAEGDVFDPDLPANRGDGSCGKEAARVEGAWKS